MERSLFLIRNDSQTIQSECEITNIIQLLSDSVGILKEKNRVGDTGISLKCLTIEL